MKTDKLLIPITAVSLCLSSGCGNSLNPSDPKIPKSSIPLSERKNNREDQNKVNYQCPEEPNIVPDYDYDFDGSGFYRICPHKTSKSEVEFHGKTHSSPVFCVFPAEVVDQHHIYTKPDFRTGAPMSECYEVGKEGSTVHGKFPESSTFGNFNAFFIVEEPSRILMQACLTGGNYYFCPHYSFGKFR